MLQPVHEGNIEGGKEEGGWWCQCPVLLLSYMLASSTCKQTLVEIKIKQEKNIPKKKRNTLGAQRMVETIIWAPFMDSAAWLSSAV